VTLNDFEQPDGPILCYFIKFLAVEAYYIKVVEDRPILSATEV